MNSTTRMQEPITLVRPATTMLALRYGGPEYNLDAMMRFLDAAPFTTDSIMMGVDIHFHRGVSVSLLGTLQEPVVTPGTWVLLDEARGELILASDDAILTMFTNLTD